LYIKFTAKPGLRSEQKPFFDLFSKVSGTTCEFLVFAQILNYKFSKTYFFLKKILNSEKILGFKKLSEKFSKKWGDQKSFLRNI
jgi:hypothetical protein